MWSFFQIFFTGKTKILVISLSLSTIASISFVVIVTFAVIIRRLYMKTMSYRKIEQGEFSTKSDLTFFIVYVEHSGCGNHTMETLSRS